MLISYILIRKVKTLLLHVLYGYLYLSSMLMFYSRIIDLSNSNIVGEIIHLFVIDILFLDCPNKSEKYINVSY